MSENSELNDLTNDLVDQYLLFLRGRGPEPDLTHLSQAQQLKMRARLDIVDALADRGPALPSLEDDRVAMRLGLVPDRRPGGGHGGPQRPALNDFTERPRRFALHALDELESAFEGRVVVDWEPPWIRWSRQGLAPLAQCSALGDSMALFISADQALVQETDHVAAFLRTYPDISAVGLLSSDAAYASIVTAAACNGAIDPVRGWLEPGEDITSDPLELTLHRYFEQRLPRWDRVADLDDLLDLGDITADTDAVVQVEIAAAMRAKPRLAYKKQAMQSLAGIDQSALAAVIVSVQTGKLTRSEAAAQVARLAEAAT